MTDIIKFPAPDEKDNMIWVCSCGCSSFQIGADNTISCSACFAKTSDHGAGWYLPPAEQKWEGPEPYIDVQGDGGPEFAKARMAQRLNEEGCITVFLAFQDGSVSTWSKVETDEQFDWLKEKLETAYELIGRGVKQCQEINRENPKV